MSRRRKDSKSEGSSGNEWIQTYSDTVTLLLTFFVLLYSFSSVDAQKFKQVANAFQNVLSGQTGETIFDFNMKNGEIPLVGETVKLGPASGGKDNELYDKLREAIDKNKLQKDVQIRNDSRGVALELKENVLFESGKAEIKEGSKAILAKVNKILTGFPNNVVIEGHTDNVPIKTANYKSNWELSTHRAVNVLRYFVETKKQNPSKFSASGCGEYRPVCTNNTEENKAKNRRVNILLVSLEKEKGKK